MEAPEARARDLFQSVDNLCHAYVAFGSLSLQDFEHLRSGIRLGCVRRTCDGGLAANIAAIMTPGEDRRSWQLLALAHIRLQKLVLCNRHRAGVSSTRNLLRHTRHNVGPPGLVREGWHAYSFSILVLSRHAAGEVKAFGLIVHHGLYMWKEVFFQLSLSCLF